MHFVTRTRLGRSASGLAASLRGSKILFRLLDSKTLPSALTQRNRFWLRIPEAATETFRRRFLLTWIDYVESVARQAEYRSKSHILDLDRYFNLRRHTSGAPSTIALYEMDMNIPDDVRENVIIRELETLAVDLIVIVNVGALSRIPRSHSLTRRAGPCFV